MVLRTKKRIYVFTFESIHRSSGRLLKSGGIADKLIENKTGRNEKTGSNFCEANQIQNVCLVLSFIHENGIRFQSHSWTDSIDILFSNIKNLIFNLVKVN
ncbi:BEM_HP_G0080040.mRNA.1.CDS.1 [Saccharomyces cerevisiae]|nr:BEM_HP_G0080040.mRNA.1.CDS.1 [Saccharomyces cerevisiae]CAI6991850.1 BEM_HP_G0080040.mRNA.1.CDS.1 [Saccharomyces cerevisiae]